MIQISKQQWGSTSSGEPVNLFKLKNTSGMEVTITNFGGRIVTCKVPDRNGRSDDVVLGFDNLDGYLGKNPYFGSLVGRFANRIANGRFTLDGQTYELARNNGQNALHGGLKGFDKVVWQAREFLKDSKPALELSYLSKDGEEGYPGNLQTTVVYALTEDNRLEIDYRATTDKPTVLNLTNHSYFDLSGQAKGDILRHVVTINADRFTPVNENLIPTGELKSVAGSPFDFREPTAIAARIDADDEQLRFALGYDHNYVLNSSGEGPNLAARVYDPDSGRILEVFTTQPGMQFYTGNHLDGTVKGKDGVVYGFRSGFCVETQHFPDSPNQTGFPPVRLDPGQRYTESTAFRFSAK
jgi:aldose 1-epimerase